MNKHINNWLDKVEGRPHNSSNKAIEKEKARQGIAKKMTRKEYEKKGWKEFRKKHPINRYLNKLKEKPEGYTL